MSVSEIRLLANELVGKGRIKARVSSNGNVLYQAKAAK